MKPAEAWAQFAAAGLAGGLASGGVPKHDLVVRAANTLLEAMVEVFGQCHECTDIGDDVCHVERKDGSEDTKLCGECYRRLRSEGRVE